jgi:hypothetical protein
MTNSAYAHDPGDRKLLCLIWTVRVKHRQAVCYFVPHPDGQELCLTIGGNSVWRHVCPTLEELFAVQRDWRQALGSGFWTAWDNAALRQRQ